MSRNVVCRITKEHGKSDQFIKIDGKYYKSQEIYDKWNEEKTRYELCYEKILSLFDFPYSPNVAKELKKLREHYEYTTIYKTIIVCEKDIKWALNNTIRDKNEFLKSRYTFAIIGRKINDVLASERRAKYERKVETQQIEMIDEYDIPANTNSKKVDLSNFLED